MRPVDSVLLGATTMDVICERCGTEYEFEETLVSERGTTVKCTNCGHLFKVYRPRGGGARTWSVRDRRGKVRTLESLRELQQLIADGVLVAQDEIAGEDHAWKPLGAIAELRTFFEKAEAERSAGTPRPRETYKHGDIPPPAGRAEASQRTRAVPAEDALGSRAKKGTVLGVGQSAASRIDLRFSGARADFSDQVTVVKKAGAELLAEAERRDMERSTMPKVEVELDLHAPEVVTVPRHRPPPPEARRSEPSRPAARVAPPPSPSPASRPPPSRPPPSHPPAASHPPPSYPPQSHPTPSHPTQMATPPTPAAPVAAPPPSSPAPAAAPPHPTPPPAHATEPPSAPGAHTPPPSPYSAGHPPGDAIGAHAARPPGFVASNERAAPRPASHAPSRPPEDTTGSLSTRPPQVDPVEYDPLRRGRSRSGVWVSLVLLLAAGLGVALGWPQIAPLLGWVQVADAAAPHLEAGDVRLGKDHVDAYEEAITSYNQALAHGANDPRVLTRLSQAKARWAQALLFAASDVEARSDGPADDEQSAAHLLTARWRRLAEQALAHAANAVRYGGEAEAETALSDALRLSDELPRAASRLMRAETLAGGPTAETLRVKALLRAAEAEGDLSAARELAEASVAENPGLVRSRLLLARVLLAERDVAGARQQLRAILRRAPDHPAARELERAISEGIPPAPSRSEDEASPAEESQPATARTAGPRRAGRPSAAQASKTRAGERDGPPAASRRGRSSGSARSGQAQSGEGRASSARGNTPRSYNAMIQRAQARLERGDLQQAQRLYESARRLRSNGAEALNGLAYIDLDRGNASAAANKFRQAAAQGFAEAYIGLGSAYRQLGQLNQAAAAYSDYLTRLPTGSRATIARRQLETLRRRLAVASPAPEREEPPSTASSPSSTSNDANRVEADPAAPPASSPPVEPSVANTPPAPESPSQRDAPPPGPEPSQP